jgi:hypothetical protein
MKLEYKYIIGTHIMFYEIDMVPEHIDSIINAVNEIDNPENITVKLLLNKSEYFEKIDKTKLTDKQLTNKFNELISKLSHSGVKLDCNTYSDDKPLTMVDFRRDLNYFGCREHDFVIWGESDCLFPKEMFTTLEQLKSWSNSNNIHRYITTFAVRKMWDDSWKPLEHPDMTDKPLHPRTLPNGTLNPEAFSQPYSINYTMSIDEMNEINAKDDSLSIITLNTPKFDGSGLIISSDLIKAGANIPIGIFGLAAEDTAFMYSCMQVLGQKYIQFVIKNILKVHNRQHPKKRLYALDMVNGTDSTQRIKGDWYNKLRDINKKNLELCMSSRQDRFFTYEDYLKQLNKNRIKSFTLK